MPKSLLLTRTGATAIAAVLALSSTSISAQEAAVATDVTTTADPAPAASDPVVPAAADTSVVAGVAEPTAKSAPTAAMKTVSKPAKAAPVAKLAAKPALKQTATDPAPVATTVDAPAPAMPLAEAPSTPIAQPEVPPATVDSDDAAQMAFGGGLAAVALGSLALFATRRRRRSSDAEVTAETPSAVVTSREATAPALSSERSAFAWGNRAPMPAHSAPIGADPVAMAHRGPTPENPSLSLKKRLKRAAFFESRERAAAAGKAVPVSRAAGLPQRAVEMMRQSGAQRSPQLQPA